MIITGIVVTVLMTFLSSQDVAGEVIGWISTAFYVGGRFPQLYLNYKRRSIEGLSTTMYLFTIAGNVSYLTSILTASSETEHLRRNMPWIVLVLGILALDSILLLQWTYYKKAEQRSNVITENTTIDNVV